MGIRIVTKNEGKPFRIWLPGVLLGLVFLLVLLVLLIPIIIVMVGLLIWNLIPGQAKRARAYTRIFFSIPKVFWAIRGLTVDVESEDAIVKIKF